MAIPLSHIVTEDGVEHRLNDTEARAMIDRLQTQVGNINLADLDFELPSDAEFDSVKIEHSIEADSVKIEHSIEADSVKINSLIEIGSNQITSNDFSVLLSLVENAKSIEGESF